MLAFVATLAVKPDQVDNFKTTMAEVIPQVRAEPGNHLYIGHQSPDDPTRFVFYEQYTDQAAIEAHRENLATLGVDLHALLTEPPHIEFLNLLTA
ncbi:MAG: putative quinol monooxygenase [Pseudomonadota bacterium]|nr:putative quinol monooxygenase [Pseudomonadota bacterium]